MGSIGIEHEPDQVVTPLITIKPTLYQLSTVDQYVPKRWTSRVLYFGLPGDAQPESVFEVLKSSLRQVVTMYPQMTGKVVRQPSRPSWVGVQTEENGTVQFIFKNHSKTGSSTLPPFSQLREQGYPMQGLVSLVCPDVMHNEISEGSSIFAAQANFVEGGLILIGVTNHVLVDAGWLGQLYKLWAYHTANPPRGSEENAAVLDHSTDIVKQLSSGICNSSKVDPNTWVVGDSAKSTFFMPPRGTPATSIVHPKKQSEGLSRITTGSAIRIWTISATKQQELKSVAGAWSTMDSVFAMLLNRKATHANMAGRGLNEAFARIPIDMRTRLNPPISASYMGNTVAMLTSEIPTADLEGEIAIALPRIAQRLRNSIKSFSGDNLLAFIGAANALAPDKAMVYPFSTVFDPCTLLNDHSKMGIYGFDWGPILGRVERVRDIMDDVPVRHLSVCLVMPKLPDGTMEVATLFDTDVNSALEKDESFLSFFSLYGNGQLWV